MHVRRVEVENFRGIRSATWTVVGDLVCLVGPGDAGKTTLLDAIELVLSPRWNVPFNDNDFFGANTASAVRITVTVGEVPAALLVDNTKYGLNVRGWSAAGTLNDEPQDGDELVLSIRLEVDRALEPKWTVVNDRLPEGRPISAKDRELFGCVRLGTFVDRHFAWGRGSSVSRLTAGADDLSALLADAGRTARRGLAERQDVLMPNLKRAAERAEAAGRELGVTSPAAMRPLLDVESVTLGVGGLALHQGDVPVRMAGLGTKRLLAVAMQKEAVGGAGIALLDEVELGLEPHRLRRVIRALRPTAGAGRQVFLTTHSPTAVQELKAEEIHVVRTREGEVVPQRVAASLQRVVLRSSEAMLAKKVLVCEGRTELGICRGLDQAWSAGGSSFALRGVGLVDGGGSEAAALAFALAGLGYDVALLGDSDVPLDPSVEQLAAAGVKVLLWAGGLALEERLALDLPSPAVCALILWAMEQTSAASERDAIAQRLEIPPASLSEDPRQWPAAALGEGRVRTAVGKVAKQRGWFKRVDLAERVIDLVVPQLAAIADKDIAVKIALLKTWVETDA